MGPILMTDLAEIEHLVETYREWLRQRTTLKKIGSDWVEITTPFVDRHNDYIQIYAKSDGSGYQLTDDGHTIRDLESSGCLLNSPKRQQILHTALNGFGVEERSGRLSVRANQTNFPLRKHDLVQAILSVHDLFFLASPNIRSLFKEDVEAWLDLHAIRRISKVAFIGKSGYQHHFDFVIPRSQTMPERIVNAVNNPNKESAHSFIFSWLDTREERPEQSQALVILNDHDRNVPEGVLDAFNQYEIRPVLWSDRASNWERLAA